jgi:hypothetical protein
MSRATLRVCSRLSHSRKRSPLVFPPERSHVRQNVDRVLAAIECLPPNYLLSGLKQSSQRL